MLDAMAFTAPAASSCSTARFVKASRASHIVRVASVEKVRCIRIEGIAISSLQDLLLPGIAPGSVVPRSNRDNAQVALECA